MSLLAAFALRRRRITGSMRQCIRPVKNQKTMTCCFDRVKALEQGMPRRHRVEDLSRQIPSPKGVWGGYGTRQRPNRQCVILHGQKSRGSM